MIVPLLGLPIPLQAVVHLPQQLGHLLMADRMVLRRQFCRQGPRALARPAQRRFRVAAGQGLDQRFEAPRQVGIALHEGRPAPTWAPYPARRKRGLLEFLHALHDRDARQSTGSTYGRYAAMAKLTSLGGRKQSPRSLVKVRPQERHLAPAPQRGVATVIWSTSVRMAAVVLARPDVFGSSLGSNSARAIGSANTRPYRAARRSRPVRIIEIAVYSTLLYALD